MRILFLGLLLLGLAIGVRGQSAFEKNNIHSLALLPAMGDAMPETARDPLASELATQLQRQFPEMKFKTVADSLLEVKQAGKLIDLANLASVYTKLGEIDSDAAGRIVKVLGVESLLLINVQEYLAQKGKWSRGKSSYNSFRAQCYVVNSLGQPIWRHLVTYVHDPHPWLSATPDPGSEVMEKVATRIVYALSKNIQNADPKKDIKP